MARRSARKAATEISYKESEEQDELALPKKKPTPKKRASKPMEEVDTSNANHDTTEGIKDALTEIVGSDIVKEEEPEIEAETEPQSNKSNTPKKQTPKKKAKISKQEPEEPSNDTTTIPESTTSQSAPKTKNKKAPPKRELNSDGEEIKPAKKPRKTKEEKEAEMQPLAARTALNTLQKQIYIGAHVSASGGVDKSINNALHIGANAFALFLKSQRKWTSPPLSTEARDAFRSLSVEKDYNASKFVLPHGSYLVNLAAKDEEKAEQAYTCFLDDLQRCEALGIKLYNFHPGNTNGEPKADAIGRIAKQLNKAHKATSSVVILLETMAGQGNTIGSTFEDLRDIIALVEEKERIGVCLDTCHIFAAGYDLRTPETFSQTMNAFTSIIGLENLRAVHLNDSKTPINSHRDLHANIGTGFLGLRAFHSIVNSPLFRDMPIVLETPIERKGEGGKMVEDKGVWAREIKLLEGLVGMDVEGEGFRGEEGRLWEAGREEREKFQGQVDRRQKTLDGMFKRVGKRGKKKGKEGDGEESEGGCSH